MRDACTRTEGIADNIYAAGIFCSHHTSATVSPAPNLGSTRAGRSFNHAQRVSATGLSPVPDGDESLPGTPDQVEALTINGDSQGQGQSGKQYSVIHMRGSCPRLDVGSTMKFILANMAETATAERHVRDIDGVCGPLGLASHAGWDFGRRQPSGTHSTPGTPGTTGGRASGSEVKKQATRGNSISRLAYCP